MNEKLREGEIDSENELSRLRREYEATEAELALVRAERDQAIEGIIAGGKDAAKNFKDYLQRLAQAEQKAIAALEVWGDAAVKLFKLED